ncbi:MAG: NAD(P)-dependent oxidoreductase [Acidimicrobiales bacterium]
MEIRRERPASALRVAVLPSGGLADELAEALREVPVETTDEIKDADALVWCSWNPAGLTALLDQASNVRWVQLPYAGVEGYLEMIDGERTWTCAKSIYGPAVAELALGLLLTALRRIDRYVRATEWLALPASTLAGAEVAILGGGGIGRSLTAMLGPLGADVTVVSRSGAAILGARSVTNTSTSEIISTADAVVLALPLTEATTGLVDRSFLGAMKPTAWLVNVARGPVVVTKDLVDALEKGVIAGAALDVTDPEPLPKGHRLWALDNAIITPHVANTSALGHRALAELVKENGRRYGLGESLLGVIDPELGY